MDAVLNMPAPSDVTSLKSFLGFSCTPSFYRQVMQPKLNLFIDLQKRMLNGTRDPSSNLLLKGSTFFCPVTRSSPTTTLLFLLGSHVTHRFLEKEEHSFIAILMALRDRLPMFPRFCRSPSGITVRSRKRLWQ